MPQRPPLALPALLLGAAVAFAQACAPPAACPAGVQAAPPVPLDLVLANGKVVDGTGAPWFRADVGVAGGRIVEVGDLSARPAARRIDVHGDVVAPGFIDMMGQSEFYLLIDNRVESKIRQGITTEITGEGSSSVAPMTDALVGEIGDTKMLIDRFHLTIDWRDLAGYRRRFEANGSAVNLGTFVGAGNVRAAVIGLAKREATPAEVKAMEEAVELAMREGALGLSSALIYPPDSYATTEELIAMAKVAARHGGVYATHMRSEGDAEEAALEETFRIAREAKIPVEIFHLKTAGRKNWGKMRELIARISRARAEGIDVTADMYPYAAASNPLSANVPEWATDGGVDRMIARFKDPAARERIKAELWRAQTEEDPGDILLVSCSNQALTKYMGKRLTEVAKEMGRSPEDALLDLVEADRGATQVVRFLMSEEDVALGLTAPWVSICTDQSGQATDGPFAHDLAHPRAFGTAARVLGFYARERGLFSLEEGVRKMTSLPARRMRLGDRGLLRPGMAADVTVFDAERIRDRATYEAPLAYAEGVDWVVVNGRVVLDAGTLTRERPGVFLSR